MSEPTGYILTVGIDAPDLLHLNPTPETKCGGRRWNADDASIEGSRIAWQQIDERTANAMLEQGSALPCRRCGLKDHSAVADGVYGEQEGEG